METRHAVQPHPRKKRLFGLIKAKRRFASSEQSAQRLDGHAGRAGIPGSPLTAALSRRFRRPSKRVQPDESYEAWLDGVWNDEAARLLPSGSDGWDLRDLTIYVWLRLSTTPPHGAGSPLNLSCDSQKRPAYGWFHELVQDTAEAEGWTTTPCGCLTPGCASHRTATSMSRCPKIMLRPPVPSVPSWAAVGVGSRR